MREGKFSIIPHLQTTNLSERIMCLKNYCKYSWQLRMWQRVWQTDLPQLLPLDFFVGIFVAQPCGKTICHTNIPCFFRVANRFATPFATHFPTTTSGMFEHKCLQELDNYGEQYPTSALRVFCCWAARCVRTTLKL